MLIGNKNCDKCGSNYDVARDTCPACNTLNEEKKEQKSAKAILFLSPQKQLLLFLVGFVALQVIGYLIGAILDNFMSDEEVIYHLITNVVCYVSVAIGLSFVIFKDFKLFKRHLTNPYPWIAGVTGGIILIMVTITYSLCSNLIYPHEINENQNLANNMMTSFPLTSILIIGIIGPICEEFTYRLGMYSFLRRINKYVAYAITIVFFALIHINFFAENIIPELIAIPQYLFAGLCFCILYEKWGIAASTTAHITNNLFSVLYTIIAQFILSAYGAGA